MRRGASEMVKAAEVLDERSATRQRRAMEESDERTIVDWLE